MAEAVAAPPFPDLLANIDRRKVGFWGLIAGISAVFVSIIGMVETFSERLLIDPFLDMGDFVLALIPVVLGYQATYQPTLEGLPPPPKGAHNIVGGALAGLVGGTVLALFLILADVVFLRDIFPNVTTGLIDILTFENGLGFGIGAALVAGAALGAVGGALHLLEGRVRRAVIAAVTWVLALPLLALVISDAFPEVVGDWLYASGGGLRWGSALVVVAAAAGISYATGARERTLRESFAALPEHRRTGLGLVLAFALIAFGFLLPTLLGSFLNEILATVGLFLLMGLGLNIVVGLAGLLDLGYVAFFAVGAYATAVLTSPGAPKFAPELPFVLAIPIVIVAATIAGIMVGTPVIRMRGDYLAIVTLGFGEIVRILFLSDWLKPTFGGAQGILQIPSVRVWRWAVSVAVLLAAAAVLWWVWKLITDRIDLARGDNQLKLLGALVGAAIAIGAVIAATKVGFSGTFVVQGTKPQLVFYAVFFFAIVAAYISWRVQDSRIGRAWMAMREDEQVAEVMGINTVTAKLLAFITGAILASFGGALFAAKIGSIFPNSFALIVSIIVLVLIIVGGMGNIPGVAVGAIVLVGVLGGPTQPGLLREFEEFKLLIYGGLLIYMMLQRPEGLLPSARRARELHQEEFLQDAWVKGEVDAPPQPQPEGQEA